MVIVDILFVLRNDMGEIELIYFRFLLNLGSDFVWFDNLIVFEKVFISFFVVDEIKINNIEEVIRD